MPVETALPAQAKQLRRAKVVVIGGAGGVGSSVAFNLLLHGGGLDVVLVDRDPRLVTSHVMDLEQALLLGDGGSVRAGHAGDYIDADVLIVTAAVPVTVTASRMEYLNANAMIVGEVTSALASDWRGALLMVTNPVDPLLAWVHRRTGVDRRRLLGYTLNDSLRLRCGVGLARGVAPSRVGAWVLGEHGDACVPVWNRVCVDGVRVELTGGERAVAAAFLKGWYRRYVELDARRTSTWTSGVGMARMVAAIAGDTRELWPASIVLDGEYGLRDTALTVPVTLGRGGVQAVHKWPLDASQRSELARAAAQVREAARAIRHM